MLEEIDGKVPACVGQSELNTAVDSGPPHILAVWGHHLPDAGVRGREQ